MQEQYVVQLSTLYAWLRVKVNNYLMYHMREAEALRSACSALVFACRD